MQEKISASLTGPWSRIYFFYLLKLNSKFEPAGSHAHAQMATFYLQEDKNIEMTEINLRATST